MPQRINGIHKKKIIRQVEQLVDDLTRTMLINANTHTQWATQLSAENDAVEALITETQARNPSTPTAGQVATMTALLVNVTPSVDTVVVATAIVGPQDVKSPIRQAMRRIVKLKFDALSDMVLNAARAYINAIQQLRDLKANVRGNQALLDMATQAGWSPQDMQDVIDDYRPVAIALRDASKLTYAEIIAACALVPAAISPLDSVWPE